MTTIDETIDAGSAVAALAALAQVSRLAVFRLLVEAAPDGVFPGEIATRLAIPANTLSFHLKTLSQAGLVSAAQHGRNICYRADTAQMQRLLSYLTENCCGGDVGRCTPESVPAKAPRDARRTRAGC